MKRLISTLTLAAVLTLGTSQTFAGIVVTLAEQPTQCENQKTGIVVTLTSILDNILGTSFSDTKKCDSQRTGIVVT